jgi:hypothetical protein
MSATDPTTDRPTTGPNASDRDSGCTGATDVDGPEASLEGVLYLTPDGDGYILYARSPTTNLAPAC